MSTVEHLEVGLQNREYGSMTEDAYLPVEGDGFTCRSCHLPSTALSLRNTAKGTRSHTEKAHREMQEAGFGFDCNDIHFVF